MKKSGRYRFEDFKEKDVHFTNVDMDTFLDIAITLNDMANHEGLDVDTLKSMSKDALEKLNGIIKKIHD